MGQQTSLLLFRTDDIVSYYKLDETSGTVIDQLGLNNGTNNGATTNVAGKINTAYDFDGVNHDNINFSDTLPASEGSFSFWMNPTYAQNNGIRYNIISNANPLNNNGRISLKKDNDNQYKMDVGDDTGTLETISFDDSAIPQSTWSHIVMIWEAGNVEVYVNNVSVTSSAAGTRATAKPTVFRIGDWVSDASDEYYGGLDEVGIWSRALTSLEIEKLYNNGPATNSTQTFTRTITDTTNWNVEACDSDGDCGFAPANFTVFLDDEAPSINITAPINTLNYNYVGEQRNIKRNLHRY